METAKVSVLRLLKTIGTYGCILVGDFGLATFNLDVVEPMDSPHPGFLSEDLTLGA